MGTVQSVDRALMILDILARDGEAGVTEIAGHLGVHKSTVSRLIDSLEERDLVEQHDPRGKYRLGIGVLRLAGATTARLDVVQEARSVAKSLAAATGETVNIAVLSEGAALYVDQVATAGAVQSHNWVGQRIPLHATSNGKVLLAGLSDAEARKVLGRRLASYTARTVTDAGAVIKQLAEVREQGYVVVVDELEHGLTAVAAPIRNAHGDVVASFSVSGPTFRFAEREVAAATTAVVDHALEVSRRLGWRGAA
ncbi:MULTISPECIES: IclR family transcriptional regulator [unclassified Nocardioides]|uniref:IclR family transcriptional regulator n=1 Tax=unclassified Nocardioides TaxID=2615069 RepID=UPI0030150FD2